MGMDKGCPRGLVILPVVGCSIQEPDRDCLESSKMRTGLVQMFRSIYPGCSLGQGAVVPRPADFQVLNP